ncbi:vWA domain-containing protein [Nocardioides sp. SR21]|uniref:vWA domain-containing protein n=1 Tax=Nocardioides sp. SR21 TaxID=2919501 RepID=UPI001FAAE98A|nr:vWA domain-containing protein [Nocardioides sp. SR21]
MKRTLTALSVATLLALTMAPAGFADTGTIGGGTSVTTTLTGPADGASFVAGAGIPVAGTVDVGQGTAVKDTDLAFVLDTSTSTAASSGLSCGTILSCEKATTQSVVTSVDQVRSPIAAVGVVAFPGTATVPLVSPAAFSNDLSAFTSSGSTEFNVGITRARDMLTASGTSPKDVMVLLTDGDGTTAPVSGVGAIVIKAFAIAGAGCSATLQQAVSQGAAGSECQVVSSLDALPSVVTDTIDSTLDSVDITVNGTVVQTLPVTAQGQSSTPFSTTLTGIAAGNGQVVCAVAHATDAGGTGTVSDCSTISVLPAGTVVVDCTGTATCSGSATDPGRSTLEFRAPGEFNEVVTIAPTATTPPDCGGSPCKSGFNVGFPTTDPNGPIASVTLTTAQRVSILDRLKAAIYLDGTRIKAQCSSNLLIRWIRDRFGIPEPIPCSTISYRPDGRVQYFLKFNADPKITIK